MAARMRPLPLLPKPQPISRNWHEATGSRCWASCSKWHDWKPKSTCDFAASGICLEGIRTKVVLSGSIFPKTYFLESPQHVEPLLQLRRLPKRWDFDHRRAGRSTCLMPLASPDRFAPPPWRWRHPKAARSSSWRSWAIAVADRDHHDRARGVVLTDNTDPPPHFDGGG
jgi:hypothetical protein